MNIPTELQLLNNIELNPVDPGLDSPLPCTFYSHLHDCKVNVKWVQNATKSEWSHRTFTVSTPGAEQQKLNPFGTCEYSH